MAGYGGRRGPNVTQYLSSLQTDTPGDESILDEDLTIFTNSQFLDYDSGGRTVDFHTPPVKAEPEQTPSSSNDDVASSASPMADLSTGLDFMQDLTFPSVDFSPFPQTPSLPFSDGLGLHSLQHSVPFVPAAHQPVPFVPPTTPRGGDKRKRDAISNRHMTHEEEARIAAEEDKRRRNTAASARFRIKKKQREQALEKHSKEMSERVVILEGKIQQLETENKWLKGMILEKNGGNEQIKALLERGLNARDAADQAKDKEAKSKSESDVKEE